MFMLGWILDRWLVNQSTDPVVNALVEFISWLIPHGFVSAFAEKLDLPTASYPLSAEVESDKYLRLVATE